MHDTRHFKALTVPELLAMPDPRELVDGHLVQNSLAVLYGQAGRGKTFVTLRLAASVAAGLPWAGNRVRQGDVLYVAAEGTGGLKKRVSALMSHLGLKDLGGLTVITEAVDLADPGQVEALIDDFDEGSYVLVVFDTLARCIPGTEENNQKEMGIVVKHADRIREAFGATVLLVHHTGHSNQERERGSSVLRGAADTMLLLSEKNGTLELSCKKQKELEPFRPLHFGLQRELHSVVAVPLNHETVVPDLTTNERQILQAIPEEGARQKDLVDRTGIPDTTCRTAREALVAKGYVTPGENRRFFLSRDGRALLTTTTTTAPPDSLGDSPETTATTTSLEVVGGGGREWNWSRLLELAALAS